MYDDFLGENSIVIVSGANLILGEEDLKAARSIITTASVVVCQLEIKPEITQLALTMAKNAGGMSIIKPLYCTHLTNDNYGNGYK